MLTLSTKKFSPLLQNLLTTLIKSTENADKKEIHNVLLQLQDSQDDATLIHNAALKTLFYSEGNIPEELRQIINAGRDYYRDIAEMVCLEAQTEIQHSSTDPDIEDGSKEVKQKYDNALKEWDVRIGMYRGAKTCHIRDGVVLEESSPELPNRGFRMIFTVPIDKTTSSDLLSYVPIIFRCTRAALHAQYSGYGNCAEMAWLVALKIMKYGKQHGCVPKFTIVSLFGREPKDRDQALEFDADHCFVIINPPDDLRVLHHHELTKLYPASFVIDPMSRLVLKNQIFPLTEMDRLENRVVFKDNALAIHTPWLYKGVPTAIPIARITSEILATLVDSYQYWERPILREDAYTLAKLYSVGDEEDGIPKDPIKAAIFYSVAADKGNPDAVYKLGCCFEQGIGVEKNMTETVKLYQRAADMGIAQAMYKLGLCYEHGKGVEKDKTKAMSLYQQASAAGYAVATSHLAKITKRGFFSKAISGTLSTNANEHNSSCSSVTPCKLT